jgi:hypothetical protein
MQLDTSVSLPMDSISFFTAIAEINTRRNDLPNNPDAALGMAVTIEQSRAKKK